MARESNAPEKLLTVREAAQLLRLGEVTVYRLAQRRKIPAVSRRELAVQPWHARGMVAGGRLGFGKAHPGRG
ncbi:MAG: helix-turn-helix domain-containing protein [candidate division NC10 bacterium]|nr:helix-turn-helix domain-containing protein [candidate division NC10 bacterium]